MKRQPFPWKSGTRLLHVEADAKVTLKPIIMTIEMDYDQICHINY